MNINTEQIKKGIITIDEKPIYRGMSISELESVFQRKIEKENDHVGITFSRMTEDNKPVSIIMWFKGDTLSDITLNIGAFHTDDDATKYMDEWFGKRGIEWVGASYYKTEFGSLSPYLGSLGDKFFKYELCITLNYSEIPKRKFTAIKQNEKNSANFIADDSKYEIQRITYQEEDTLPLENWVGNGPHSLLDDEWSKNDRMEVVYFNISKIENDIATVIGVAEFTYFAIRDAYEESELFFILDGFTEAWGIIGFAVEKYGCGLEDKNGFTPYLLALDTIHDEIPYNKELQDFMSNENKMKLLFESVINLTSKYVEIPEEDLTLINLSSKVENNVFSYHKKVEDVVINFHRSE